MSYQYSHFYVDMSENFAHFIWKVNFKLFIQLDDLQSLLRTKLIAPSCSIIDKNDDFNFISDPILKILYNLCSFTIYCGCILNCFSVFPPAVSIYLFYCKSTSNIEADILLLQPFFYRDMQHKLSTKNRKTFAWHNEGW